MNERYKMAFGSAAIAAGFFALLTLLQFLFGHQPNGRDVNPVGFHGQGQVQINDNKKFDIEDCKQDTTCKLRFDFSTDANGGQLVELRCDDFDNCLAFSGDNVNLSYPYDATGPIHKVNGRIVKVVTRNRHKDESGLGFHANGVMHVEDNSLNLGACTTGASCNLRFDFSTSAEKDLLAFPCANYDYCMLFHDAWADVANGPAQQKFSDRLNGRLVLNP